MSRCYGPGCTIPLGPHSDSFDFCSPNCQENYHARAVDRVWERGREAITDEFRTLIARAVDEGPDPLICLA